MKARPTPLFDQAHIAPLRALTPTPLQSPSKDGRLSTPYAGEEETAAPRSPSPSGRRWPEGPDEGLPTIGALDWPAIEHDLDAYGCAIAPKLISRETCRDLAALYPDDARFRSRVVMAKPRLWPRRVQIFLQSAARSDRRAPPWLLSASGADRGPVERGDGRFRPLSRGTRCVSGALPSGGQKRPTPLLLRYGPGDYNCLHQDVYGEHLFPLQLAILLSEPGHDFTGGEFVLTEQRPRMQSRAEVAPLTQGDGVIFAVRERPVEGTRGTYRVNLRHGVSRIKSGERFTLGVIFHDAT